MQKINTGIRVLRCFLLIFIFILILVLLISSGYKHTEASYHFSNFTGTSPIHVYKTTGTTPRGVTPEQIKNLYHLVPSNMAPKNPQSEVSARLVRAVPSRIAIIVAYDNPLIEKDLADFSTQFNLPSCTIKSGCLEKHIMTPLTKEKAGMKMNTKADPHWSLETALDVEWAHAIAPQANILLVEAPTPSGKNLLQAVDYAAERNDIVAISMSWGGAEFPEEVSLDRHFISRSGATFFASSGDRGSGANWPASSPNVIAVGGTSLTISSDGLLISETAWAGSGGGVSLFEKAPPWQNTYSIPHSGGMRAIPDVAYDADPATGFPIIHDGIWRTVGGTSAGAPQWAAIAALYSTYSMSHTDVNKQPSNKIHTLTAQTLYIDKASLNSSTYFRDIISGSNGNCGYLCNARARYDYVTGLGSPQTILF